MRVNFIYPHNEISRIMTAAVISFRFRQDLLANPLAAIHNGYGDETFSLKRNEAEQIASIRASSLEEFAIKLISH